MFHTFLIKYAEIGLKGKNRYVFEDALVSHIHHSLKRLDGKFIQPLIHHWGISGTIQEIIYRLLTVIIVNLQDYTGYGKMCMILIMLEHAITEDILLTRTSIL